MRVTQLLLLHLMLLLTAPTLLAQDTGSNSRSGKQPDSTAQALEMTEWMERIEKKLDDLLKSKGASNEPQKKIDLKKLEADSLRLLSKIDQIEKSNSDLRIQLAIEKSAASANKVEAQTRKTEAVELSKKHTGGGDRGGNDHGGRSAGRAVKEHAAASYRAITIEQDNTGSIQVECGPPARGAERAGEGARRQAERSIERAASGEDGDLP
jgi:hypothetical protein